MERVRTLTAAAGLVAALGLGPGCIHVHTDADGKVKSVELKATEPTAAAQVKVADGPKVDAGVVQAGALVPAPAGAFSSPSISKLIGLGDATKGTATDIALTWQNRIARLPDPTRGGATGPGIVGQMFLFGPGYQNTAVNGNLSIEMFDETPRPGSPATPRRIGGWTFDRDSLRRLLTVDERFGKSYALFLPWPDYTPDVTRVRLVAKYEPERGYTLFAPPAVLTIDTSTPGSPVGGGGGLAGAGNAPITFGGAPTATGGFTPATPAAPPLNPLPIGGGPAIPPGTLPAGLPPLVVTPTNR